MKRTSRMHIGSRTVALSIALFAGLGSGGLPAWAANAVETLPARELIAGVIDDSRLVTLAGNTRSEANAANDRGPVEGSLALDHLQLLLKRPAEREQADRKSVV